MKIKLILSSFIALIIIGSSVPSSAWDLSDPYLIANGLDLYSTSARPYVSSDARYVGFQSRASHLVANDNNGQQDVFRKDIVTGEMIRLSSITANGEILDTYGGGINGMSSDGSKVLITTATPLSDEDTNNLLADVYIRDIPNSTTTLVSVGEQGQSCNRSCNAISMSSDGNTIIFTSESNNLISGTNTYAPRYYKRDIAAGTTELLSLPATGFADIMNVSSDGRFIVYIDSYIVNDQGTTYTWRDIRVYDRNTSESKYANVNSDGERANHPNTGGSPSISNDGRYVSFLSFADNLVNNDTNHKSDIFTHDLVTGQTERVSVKSNGEEGNAGSFGGKTSTDGRYVVFDSESQFTSVNAPYGGRPVYIHDRFTNLTRKVTPEPQPIGSYGEPRGYTISDDNKYVIFTKNDTLMMRSIEAIFTDNTPPAIQPLLTPQANGYGWSRTPVQLTWGLLELDSLLTTQAGCDPISVNSETTSAGLTFTCTATSAGGTSTQSATIKYDATLPSVTYSYSVAPNVHGWNNSDVTITYVCDDQLSGIGGCSDPFTFIHESADQFFQGTATDRAGNIKTTGVIPIKIDETLPSGAFTGSTTVMKFLGQTVSGTAGDELSGVEKVEIVNGTTTISSQNGGITLNCDTANTNCTWSASPGALTSGASNLTLRVTDLAGNVYTTTKQYTII